MAVLDGNPEIVSSRADTLINTSAAIEAVIDDFRDIVDDDTSKAIDKLDDLADEVRTQLERIHERYDGTAHALTDYAVEMKSCHQRAEEAYDDLQVALANQHEAQNELLAAQLGVNTCSPDTDSTAADDRLDSARRSFEMANAAVRDAQDRIDQAREDMEDAAEDAKDRIDRAIADTNEDWRDAVGDFFSDLGDFLSNLDDWIADFFSAIVDFLQVLATVITKILTNLKLLATILLIAAIFGPWAAAAFVLWVAYSVYNATSGTAEATRYDPTDPTQEPDLKKRLAVGGEPTLRNLMRGAVEVDTLGGDDKTVVKITKVKGADGEWYYTVTVPSTQEWLATIDDHGTVGDTQSNLALMLTPELQTQYEQFVIDAMDEAGITPEDNVLMNGWSQGGIMAGHLAANRPELGIDAIAVAGAPIDHMDIPSSVEVVNLNHNWDAVPDLDHLVGDGTPTNNDHWSTPNVDSPKGGYPHNGDAYATSWENLYDSGELPDLSNYFSSDYETSYYQFSE